MNTALTNLQSKVDDNVGAKKIATPDPAKVKAEDLDEIFSDIIAYLNGLSAPPENPSGVSFITAPTFTISGNSITESASVVNNDGVTVNVPAPALPLTIPYAATGKKRLDSIVVNYLATPAVYERIAGDEVNANSIAARKPIPANRLFAHDIDVADGALGETEMPGTSYTFDSTPTAGSSNPVTSGGIKTYVDAQIAPKDSEKIYFSPDAPVQEFIHYGKFLAAELITFDGSTAANYSFKWKTDGGTFSASIASISALTTALSGLTNTSKTTIQQTSNYASASATIIRYNR